MNLLEQKVIVDEIVVTSNTLLEIRDRLKLITETIHLKPESIYYYDIDEGTYHIDSNPDTMYNINNHPMKVELTKDEYFERTLPGWGIDILNCLEE